MSKMASADRSLSVTVWNSLRTHFERVLDAPVEDRERYLSELNRKEPVLCAMLSDLLHSDSGGFLSAPPWHPTLEDRPPRCCQPGQVVIDRFEIEALLGEGGSGQVYRAYDRHRQIRIALKTIHPVLNRGAFSTNTLRNELNTATQVSHPNVCRLFDITIGGTEADVSFITMELLEGESLAVRIRRGPFEPSAAYPIVLQLVNGLAAAHDRGIVHRDLKPANIILVPTEAGDRAVITDFGLAQEIRPGTDLSLTLTSEIAGTPAYMAPEQLEGRRTTRAVDIHALGVIMFEMLTGRLPFEGDTILAIAAARLNGDAPSPLRYRPGMDRRWERAILQCLDRDPGKRPASALDVLPLLEISPPTKWPRRTLLAALGAAVATAVCFEVAPRGRNPDAETAFARGVVFNQRRTSEGIKNAIREFRMATKLEPSWPAAWLNLADVYGAAGNAEVIDPTTALAEARIAAQRAISLDSRLARAHGSLAWTLSLDLDRWPQAEPEFRRAIELDGKDAEVRRWFAVYLRKVGRFREAEQQNREGLSLTRSTDPRLSAELAFLFFTARQKDRFESQVADAQFLFPNDSVVECMVAKSLEIQCKFAQALDTLNYVERLGMNHVTVLALKAGVYISSGDTAQARQLAGELEAIWRDHPIDGLLLAGIYSRLNETDKAFDTLERAYRRRDNTLLSLATSPWLDALRPDPRLRAWLLRLHFTDQIMQRMEFKASSEIGFSSHPQRTGTS